MKKNIFVFFPTPSSFHYVYKERADFSAAALLMPTNQFNPPPHHPPKKAADLIPSWFKFRAEAQIIDAASYVFQQLCKCRQRHIVRTEFLMFSFITEEHINTVKWREVTKVFHCVNTSPSVFGVE